MRMGRVCILALTIASCSPADGSASDTAIESRIDQPSTPTTSPAIASTPNEETIEESIDESLRRVLTEWYGAGEIGGAVAAIGLADGSIHVATVGDARPCEPSRPDDLMRVGSITKSFVAALTLRLDDLGVLDIDNSVSAHLPDLEIDGSVTIRDLMAHTSDIVDPDPDVLIGLFLEDPGRRFDVEELFALTGFPASPSDRTGDFAYANSNYLVLGRVIEATAGTDIATIMRREILDRAGLHHTFLAGAEPVPELIVPGNVDLDGDGLEDSLRDVPYLAVESAAWAAGALVSTPNDLIDFARALFAGALISDAALREMTDTSAADGADLDAAEIGAGLGIFDFGINGRTAYGNSGQVPGSHANFVHDEQTSTTAVVFTNCPSCAGGGNDTWDLLVDLLAGADMDP